MCPLLSNLISRSERLELSQGRKKNFILFCFVLRAWQHVKRSQFDNTRCIASAAKLCAHLSPHNSISPTSIGWITSRFHYFLRFPLALWFARQNYTATLFLRLLLSRFISTKPKTLADKGFYDHTGVDARLRQSDMYPLGGGAVLRRIYSCFGFVSCLYAVCVHCIAA